MNVTDETLYLYAPEARDIWLSTLPSQNEIPEHQFTARFERKMKKLLKEQRHSPPTNQVLHYIRKAAAVFLITFSIIFCGMMTVEAYREKVIEVIVQVFNELTDYRFSSTQSDGALPSVTFGYIPNGMEETTSETYDGYSFTLYENIDGQFFELTQNLIQTGTDHHLILNTEDADNDYFFINEDEAVANTKNGDGTVIWSHQDVLYTLVGNLPIKVLKDIAKQIK